MIVSVFMINGVINCVFLANHKEYLFLQPFVNHMLFFALIRKDHSIDTALYGDKNILKMTVKPITNHFNFGEIIKTYCIGIII